MIGSTNIQINIGTAKTSKGGAITHKRSQYNLNTVSSFYLALLDFALLSQAQELAA